MITAEGGGVTATAGRREMGTLRGGFGAGVGASIAMMLVMALLRFTSNTISIPELMEESLVRLAGGQLESWIINALGVGGKALLLVSVVEGTLLLGGLLGWAFTRFWPLRSNLSTLPRWAHGALYGLLVGFVLNALFLPLVGQGVFGVNALGATAPPEVSRALYGTSLAPWGLPVFLSMFLLSLVFGLALVALLPWPRTARNESGDVAAVAQPEDPGRRDFVRALGGGALAVAGGAGLWLAIRQALEAPRAAGVQEVEVAQNGAPTAAPNAPSGEVRATPVPSTSFANVKAKLVPEITPTENFYITTKNFVDPTVDGNAWSLTFSGMVQAGYALNLEDLLEMSAQERVETLACISNPVGGELIGNARWKGVDFAELLKRARPSDNASEVILRAADGYSDSIPISVALLNGCFLAYEMNGEPLTHKHGYPARLLVPNIFGMKNVKWITEVELTNRDHKGYWEAQGWSDIAEYQTMARIDYPEEGIASGPVYIGGVAFAGSRGIQRVEVSTDGGKSWGDASLRPSLGKDTWTQWTYPWIAERGEHELVARATDGTGQVQTARKQDTFPDGATGYHIKKVRVG